MLTCGLENKFYGHSILRGAVVRHGKDCALSSGKLLGRLAEAQ